MRDRVVAYVLAGERQGLALGVHHLRHALEHHVAVGQRSRGFVAAGETDAAQDVWALRIVECAQGGQHRQRGVDLGQRLALEPVAVRYACAVSRR